MYIKLGNLFKLSLWFHRKIRLSLSFLMVVFTLPSCVNSPILNDTFLKQAGNDSISVTSRDSVFDLLDKKWISSTYFDRGLKYESSRLKVVSLSDLLNVYSPEESVDAILLHCADDYQGIISTNDVKKYDLQLALKIELSQGSIRPDWLQPLLIVVPNHTNPPFYERFLTANITELRFVSIADYYAPLRSLSIGNPSIRFGLDIYKDNCLFCHSINNIGGNKGGSLLVRFDLGLDSEINRLKDRFIEMHGGDNSNKQNMEQFLVNGQLDLLLEFLHEMAINEKLNNQK